MYINEFCECFILFVYGTFFFNLSQAKALPYLELLGSRVYCTNYKCKFDMEDVENISIIKYFFNYSIKFLQMCTVYMFTLNVMHALKNFEFNLFGDNLHSVPRQPWSWPMNLLGYSMALFFRKRLQIWVPYYSSFKS